MLFLGVQEDKMTVKETAEYINNSCKDLPVRERREFELEGFAINITSIAALSVALGKLNLNSAQAGTILAVSYFDQKITVRRLVRSR
jgi:hypothetical protein